MIIDFVGFNKARLDNDRRMKRERRELAQAFNEFTRLNPMATAGQFQGFIDTMSGGSNYLRGGMPSGDALNAVIKSADQRRSLADKERERNNFRWNIETNNLLSDAALGVMLNYKQDKDGEYSGADFTAMADELKKKFPNADFDALGINPISLFDRNKKNEYIQKKIVELQPQITAMVNNARGNITPELISKTFPSLPKAFTAAIIESAQLAETERKKTYTRNENSAILREIEKAITRNDQDIYGTITGMFDASALPEKGDAQWENWQTQATENLNNRRDKFARDRYGEMLNLALGLADRGLENIYSEVSRVYGAENLPPPTDPLWADIQKKATQQYEDKQYDRMTKIKGDIMNYIMELKRDGITDIYSAVVERFGAENVMSKDSAMFKAIQLEADKVIADQDTKRTNEAYALLDTQVDELKQNKAIQQALFLDDKSTQLQKIKDIIRNSVSPQTLAQVYPDGVPESFYTGILNEITDALIVQQRSDITQAQKNVQGESIKAEKAFVDQNLVKVQKWFGDYNKGQFDERIVGATGGAGQQAAAMLANRYEMNQQAMYRMQQIMLDPNLPPDIARDQVKLMNLIANDEQFLASTTTLSEAKSDIRDQYQGTYGRFSQATVGEYRNEVLQDINTSIGDVQADINTITLRFADQYDKQIAAFNDLLMKLEQGQAVVMGQLNDRRDRAKDFSGWRTAGTEAWDDALFFGEGDTVEAQLKSSIDSLMNEIQGKINLAKQKKAAQAQLNQTPDPQNTTELSQDQSAFRQQFGDVIDNKMITSKLDLIKKEQVRNIGPIGYFLGNELDREKSKLIKSFLELDNVYDKFVENPDKLREFSADPYEFIVGNINDEWVRNFWTTREGKEFIKSLNLTIPQARQ